MIEKESIPPWYKQFWPWVLIGLPLTAVIAGIATVWIASQNATEMVVDDYYKKGLAINRENEKSTAAERLGIKGTLHFAENGEISLQLEGSIQSDTDRLILTLSHSTLAENDRVLLLNKVAGNHFSANAIPFGQGKWHLIIEPPTKDWQIRGILEPASDGFVSVYPQ